MALLGIVGGLSRHAAGVAGAALLRGAAPAFTRASHSENTNHFLKEASYRAHFIGLLPGAIAQAPGGRHAALARAGRSRSRRCSSTDISR
jgi:hypothetical protein